MKPGLLQPTLVRVSDDAAMTIRELVRAVKVVHLPVPETSSA